MIGVASNAIAVERTMAMVLDASIYNHTIEMHKQRMDRKVNKPAAENRNADTIGGTGHCFIHDLAPGSDCGVFTS